MSPVAPATNSLDLSDEPVAAPSPAPAAAPAGRRAVELPPPLRVAAAGRLALTRHAPTVTLTRVQSGVGTLMIEAARSDELADLRVGAAYELTSGVASTVELSSDRRTAPLQSRRPVIVASHDRYERLAIDLRQVRELRRVAVYVFSDSNSTLTWGGTLVVHTAAGARVEIPLDDIAPGHAAVALSMYQVGGELVLRSERHGNLPSVREACRAFGFDAISWLDDRVPVD